MTTLEDLQSAVEALRREPGQRWLYGPICYPGEHRSYTTGLPTYLRWLREVEQGVANPAERLQRLRLVYHGRLATGDHVPDDVIRTDTALALVPITVLDVEHVATLNGLARTGYLRVGSGPAGEPLVVDQTQILLLADLNANSATELGTALGARLLLGWSAVLADAWLWFDQQRSIAKQTVEAAGGTFVENPTDLTQPLAWLAAGKVARSPAERLFGAMDAAIIAPPNAPTASSLADRMAAYYGPPPAHPPSPDPGYAVSRFQTFAQRCDPAIPHNTDGTLTEAAPAAIRGAIREAAWWRLYWRLLRRTSPWRAGADANAAMDSPWGAAMLDRLRDDFVAFLAAGQAAGASSWSRGQWPGKRTWLEPYGGYLLQRDDRDVMGIWGGRSRGGQSGQFVETLQRRLRDIGFPVNDDPGVFGESTEFAVRELQLQAAGARVTAIGGPAVPMEADFDCHRRYLGPAHGMVDGETARTVDLWWSPADHGFPAIRIVPFQLVLPVPADVMERGTHTLFTWQALTQAKAAAGLTTQQWRDLGDRQKNLWRRRLLSRCGHGGADPDPPFEFGSADLRNVFQLEAIAEFFLNFRDPWLPRDIVERVGGNVPRGPSEDDYISVNLLDPVGDAATGVAGGAGAARKLQLDGTWSLKCAARTVYFRDLIYLARTARWHRITAVDPDNRIVTLATPHGLAAGQTTGWVTRLRPRLIFVDPLGSRPGLDRGFAATVSAATVRLDQDTDPEALRRININFDTIYLASDVARSSRTYRIKGVDVAARTITVDDQPLLDGGVTRWHIPAGLSGRLGRFACNFSPAQLGIDHYDAAAFLVYQGEVQAVYAWTSYTSTRYPPFDDQRSSIRGNYIYDCVSCRARNENPHGFWINYGFVVSDTDTAEPSAGTIAEARYYFDNITNPPFPPPADNGFVHPDPDGKGAIMVHDGHTNADGDAASNSGSAGCLVSPRLYTLRNLLLDLDSQERVLAPARTDPAVEAAERQALAIVRAHPDRATSQQLWLDTLAGTGPRPPGVGHKRGSMCGG
jgi:hypothetical protein